MKTINLNTLDGVKLTLFPDNQPHIQLNDISEHEGVDIICSITSPSKLLQLLETSEALTGARAFKNNLFISYLMSARYDRRMLTGDGFDLQVIADLINSCGFTNIKLLDVHSEISTRLIRGSYNIIPDLLIEYRNNFENPLYICPDKGAINRLPKNVDAIYCNKERDLGTGHITIEVNNPEKCLNRNCIIVDDLCDGGGTFIGIAQQINKPKHLTLAVTHGIFSKGLKELTHYFDLIITTNSYPLDEEFANYSKLKIVDIY